jgi:type 1 fimbria pilin
MKRFVLSIAALALAANWGFAQSKKGTFTGEIMDSSCAKMGSHEMMEKEHKMAHDAKACTLGCVRMGAKFVLYDTATKTVYALDDQHKPEAFAGQKVKVSGTVDSATSTIHVESIAAAS